MCPTSATLSTQHIALSGNGDRRQAIVVIFLRGAADGLNMVAPVGEDEYYRARPTIGLRAKDALKLDGFFALHPRLAPLHSLYVHGDLAIVHAVGSEDETRSHFEAQDLMEHGGPGGGGWLARHLRHREGPATSALAAIAVSDALPECLRGAPAATAIQSLETYSLGAGADPFAAQLRRLYEAEGGLLGQSAKETLDSLARIEKLRQAPYKPAAGADYGKDDFSAGLRQIAQMIKGRVGLEAASLDLGGWDSHFAQTTLMEPLMVRLAQGLAAFRVDLGEDFERTTVVVMTEFGRRVAENSALGTDHGRASVMFVLGGGVRGGRVVAEWPGLKRELLDGPGDLRVTTNYRNVLGPILARHGASPAALERIFPAFALQPVDLWKS